MNITPNTVAAFVDADHVLTAERAIENTTYGKELKSTISDLYHLKAIKYMLENPGVSVDKAVEHSFSAGMTEVTGIHLAAIKDAGRQIRESHETYNKFRPAEIDQKLYDNAARFDAKVGGFMESTAQEIKRALGMKEGMIKLERETALAQTQPGTSLTDLTPNIKRDQEITR